MKIRTLIAVLALAFSNLALAGGSVIVTAPDVPLPDLLRPIPSLSVGGSVIS